MIQLGSGERNQGERKISIRICAKELNKKICAKELNKGLLKILMEPALLWLVRSRLDGSRFPSKSVQRDSMR
jgi:hypothetical protein